MMKKIMTAFLLILCFSSYIKKNKSVFIPPGTIRVTDNFYADKNEITNFSWYEFILWNKTKYGASSKEYLASIPDTTVWNDAGISPYGHSGYYRHPAFKSYLAVGISYEQALAFCRWRTERVKYYLILTKKPVVNFQYRLPTKNEWELLAAEGREVFNQENFYKLAGKTKEKSVYHVHTNANCNFNDSVPMHARIGPISLYSKNELGLYDMIGNVSEMVAETSISKGGNWQSTLENCRVGKDQFYTKPQAWLGFRCVVDLNY